LNTYRDPHSLVHSHGFPYSIKVAFPTTTALWCNG
jgi:hypothetical protein